MPLIVYNLELVWRACALDTLFKVANAHICRVLQFAQSDPSSQEIDSTRLQLRLSRFYKRIVYTS